MAEIKAINEGKSTLSIDRFGGADFTSNNTKVSVRRSPDTINMIADELFFPVKRTGYKKVIPDALGGAVNGLYKYISPDKQEAHLLVHAGTKMYRFYEDGSAPTDVTSAVTPMADHSSIAFNMGGKLYILDGSHYFAYAGSKVDTVTSFFAPTTHQGLKPDASNEKDTRYQSENMMMCHVKNSFVSDGTQASYQLCEKVGDDTFIEVIVNGESKTCDTDFTFYVDSGEKGTVTFLSGHIPAKDAEVVVTFAMEPSDPDGYNKIMGCTIFSIFGGKNDTRVFLSGNPKYRNMDWQSGLYDPTYFPVDGFTKVGSDSTAIVGYTRQYDTQIVVKEDNDVDATHYLRTYSIDEDGKACYQLQQGASGSGAVSSRSFATLGDVPLFLSKKGVYGVMGTSVALQRTIQPKSTLINNRLLAEPNLEKAVAVEFENKYYLCLNGHCYVADGNQRYTAESGGVQYEWYYWENIPAACFMEHNGYLYFGADDGRVCRFYKKEEADAYQDDGAAIPCKWTTPFFDFGTNAVYKTLHRIYLTIRPYSHANITVKVSTQDSEDREIYSDSMAIFDFDHFDFTYFTFQTAFTAKTFAIREKIKNVELLQLEFSNSNLYEFLGIVGLQVIFKENGYVKNRR